MAGWNGERGTTVRIQTVRTPDPLVCLGSWLIALRRASEEAESQWRVRSPPWLVYGGSVRVQLSNATQCDV